MVKKILSLGLVAVMALSVIIAMPLVSSAAEVERSFYAENMEVFYVKTTTDENGSVTKQEISKVNWSNASTQYGTSNNDFFIAKIKLDGNYSAFSEVLFSNRWSVTSGKEYSFYGVITTAEEFNRAQESATITENFFTQPKNTNNFAKDAVAAEGTATNRRFVFKNNIPAVTDGHMYIAFQGTGDDGVSYPRARLNANNKGNWKLTVTGTKEVVTDTATVTTAYITGSETQQTIDCEADGTEGLEVVSATKWAFYKMDTGYTYENVNSVSLTVPTYKESSLTATIHLYELTEEEWNAVTAGGDNTLKVADKQNLFVSPYVNKTSFLKQNTAATKTEYTFDLTAKYAEKAKSGVIYLCLGYANNNAAAPRTGTIYTPTLTITGVHGEYTAPAVTTLDDSYLAWNGANYSLYTTATSGTASLIAATFNGDAMVDAELIMIDASTAVNGVISGTTTLEEGENLKAFLWKEGTLVPIKNVIEF